MSIGRVVRDEATTDFLDGTARGQFLLQQCGSCGTVAGPQERTCAACHCADLTARPAEGGATVVSWTVAHTRRADGGPDELTVLAIGELTEGPWWWSQIVDADPPAVRVGLPLRIDFVQPEGSEAVPVFRVATGADRETFDPDRNEE